MKKILAALLLAILVLSAVPCLAESVPTIRITIVMNPLVTDYEDNYFTKWITEGQYREYLSTETPTVGVCFYTHLGFVGPTDENKNQYQYMPYLIGADGKQRVSSGRWITVWSGPIPRAGSGGRCARSTIFRIWI